MKCLNCGAEIKTGNFCEYCGSEVPVEKPTTIHITNNYYGNFNDSANATTVRENNNNIKKRKGCFWWLLMLCFWPIALSIWFYKTDKIVLAKKWKIAIIAAFWLLALVFGGLSEDTPTEPSDTSVESTSQNETSETADDINTNQDAVAVENSEEAIIKDKLYVIDTFVKKYNAIASTSITDSFEIDIHDKEAGYYRTEFRLSAYDDAKAKRGYIGEEIIDIVCTDGFNIRIYFNTDDADVAEDVFNSIALNVYPDLTEEELTEASDEIHKRDYNDGRGLLRDINYYYLDELFMDNVMYAE